MTLQVELKIIKTDKKYLWNAYGKFFERLYLRTINLRA